MPGLSAIGAEEYANSHRRAMFYCSRGCASTHGHLGIMIVHHVSGDLPFGDVKKLNHRYPVTSAGTRITVGGSAPTATVNHRYAM